MVAHHGLHIGTRFGIDRGRCRVGGSGVLFRVFKRLEIIDLGGNPVTITGRRQRVLLAILLVNANEWINSRRLVEMVWDDKPPKSAMANLKTFVWQLRQILPPSPDGERIEARRGEYRLRARADELDLLMVTELVAEGRRRRADDDPGAERSLARAVRLWRGDLAGDLLDNPALAIEHERSMEQRWALLEDWFDVRLRRGGDADVVRDLREVLAARPLRERLWGQFMLAQYRSGQRAEALATYQELYALLDRELGIVPGPALQEMQRKILGDDPSLRREDPARPQPLAHLPADLLSFTGRSEELAAVLASIGDTPPGGRSRAAVCAIDGMAGVGKTAFAIHAAHRLLPDFPDGQLFIDMHGFTDGVPPVEPADALDRLLRALGVRGDLIPRDPDDRAALFRSRLAGRRILLVLDNVAHVGQVAPLVPASPGCLVLVTGRQRLLGLDDVLSISLDVLSRDKAIDLFSRVVGRQRADREAERVAEVVELCGRLPLAVRIAAARLDARPTWSVAHLAERLQDRRHRLAELEIGQRSVVAALQVSYQHLTSELKRVLRILGLYPGLDIDTDAAAALTGLPPRQVDRLLETLVDVHLLQQRGHRRYRFHDLIRQHAATLADLEEPQGSRHQAMRGLIDHWCWAAQSAAQQIQPGRTPVCAAPEPASALRFDTADQAIDWFTVEHKNLLVGVCYAERHRLYRQAYHLADSLRPFYYSRGQIDDWLLTSRLGLAAARMSGDELAIAVSLTNAASAKWTAGQNVEALAEQTEARELFHRLGDRQSAARAAVAAGHILFRLGRYAESLDRQWQALEVLDDLGDVPGRAAVRCLAGLLLWRLGQYEESLHQQRISLADYTELGDLSGQADSLTLMALVHVRLGQEAEAVDRARTALDLYRRSHEHRGQAYALNVLGTVYASQGRHAEALGKFSHALKLIREVGERGTEARTLSLLGMVHRRRGDLILALEHQDRALSVTRETGDPGVECEVLNEFGRTRSANGEWERAVEHHRQALRIATMVADPYEQAEAHEGLAVALTALGDPEAAGGHRRAAAERYADLGLAEPRILMEEAVPNRS
ncbi:tetratricopeptide repeat protein [Micromonospora sp. NPDC126480]|uniref:AfsR/SARP family transcriptional regulator n=1 Tax=Micromonospora sp. NPDC126480 TaxID=3155312 RepID=UPI00332B6997